jgi:Na+/H+ antiporter NhaD/arsenite permease-like protein
VPGGPTVNQDALIAGVIFLGAYALIAIERPDRTIVAVMGGLLMVALGVLSQHEAFAAVDLGVIFLLSGMMVIASVLSRTGFFEWIAIRSVTLSRGRPIVLLMLLSAITAVLSAFLDNVTTVVLVTPVMLSVSKRLGVSPIPYLVAAILSSNIGGTATLIGDPPNIMIGSAAGLGFGAFLANLGPVVVIIFILFLGMMRVAFGGHLQVPSERRAAALEATEDDVIKDRSLLVRALLVTAATIVGFLAHGALDVEPATVALLGAMAMLLVSGIEPRQALREIEWNTLFFFVGLFIMVQGLVTTGIIGGLAEELVQITGGQESVATISLLWFSAIVSAVVDNIPYTATAIPVVQHFAERGVDPQPLWWALALGACLGGNLTIVGASANVVVSNVSRQAGHPITFGQFIKYGSVVVLMSLAVSTVYVWVRYLA